MRRQSRGGKRQADVHLRVDPESSERILISTNVNPEREPEKSVRYRRRTTSFKGRSPGAEKRRASVPAFYRLNIKHTTTRKNLLQRIGSRLARLGDDFVRRKDAHRTSTNNNYTTGKIGNKSCENEKKTLKEYARHLAEVGDYLNMLYSLESSQVYSESYNTTLAENCLVLTSILIGLKNNNVVVVNARDLSTLSSLCRVHRAKSLSRARR